MEYTKYSSISTDELFDFLNGSAQLSDLEKELAFRLDTALCMLSEYIEDEYDEDDDDDQYTGGPSKSCH